MTRSSPWSDEPTIVGARVVLRPFTASDTHRVELEVLAHDPRALRVYERAGFVVEGRRRDALLFDGDRVDALTMAVLRPDWLDDHSRHRT